MIKTLKYLVEKVDNIYVQMKNLDRQMETTKKIQQTGKLEMKNMIL